MTVAKNVLPRRQMTAKQWLQHPGCHDLLAGRINLLGGPIESNKSTYLALRAALHSALGLKVGIMSSEDEWNDYGPRLVAAGADIGRCAFRETAYTFPDSTETVMRWVKRDRISLLIIDLANDYVRGRRLRDAYRPLKTACARAGCTVLMALHTNKGLRPGQRAIDAFPGPPREIQGLAKVALVIAKSQEAPLGLRHVGSAKGNYREPQPSMSYAVESIDLEPDENTGVAEPIHDVVLLRPVGPCPLTSEEILQQASKVGQAEEDDAPARSEASRVLAEILKDGGKHKVSEIRQVTDQMGLSWSTVKRARVLLGVEHSREKGSNDHYWHAPTGPLAELRQGDDPDGPEADPDWTVPDA